MLRAPARWLGLGRKDLVYNVIMSLAIIVNGGLPVNVCLCDLVLPASRLRIRRFSPELAGLCSKTRSHERVDHDVCNRALVLNYLVLQSDHEVYTAVMRRYSNWRLIR